MRSPIPRAGRESESAGRTDAEHRGTPETAQMDTGRSGEPLRCNAAPDQRSAPRPRLPLLARRDGQHRDGAGLPRAPRSRSRLSRVPGNPPHTPPRETRFRRTAESSRPKRLQNTACPPAPVSIIIREVVRPCPSALSAGSGVRPPIDAAARQPRHWDETPGDKQISGAWRATASVNSGAGTYQDESRPGKPFGAACLIAGAMGCWRQESFGSFGVGSNVQCPDSASSRSCADRLQRASTPPEVFLGVHWRACERPLFY